MTFPSPKRLLTEWNLKPKHNFGQNFLHNPELVERIAQRVAPDHAGTVVEIGAGLGALTSSLLAHSTRVIAIERDRDLIPILHEQFLPAIEEGKFVLLEEDAKATNYEALFENSPKPSVLAGNLPYQLTGPLMRRVVELSKVIDRAVFMVQLEVADRLCAAPGTSNYGALSVFVQACFSVERVMTVGSGSFYPQPRVDSAVVALTPLRPPIAEETQIFRELVQRAFQQRRKMLRNAWQKLAFATDDALRQAATRAGVNLDARGETLSVRDFARVALELSS